MRSRRFVCGILGVGFFCAAFGQPRVIVIQSGDQELRRSAYKLRLCPEELRDARVALEEAHKLAADVVFDAPIADIAGLWIRLEPDRAASALQELIDQLRHLAEKSQDSSEYRQLTHSMESLLRPLREIDPDSAENCLAEWPEPQWAKGDANLRKSIEEMRKEHVLWAASVDVDQALERLPSAEGGRVDLRLRNPVIIQLYASGREAEAKALVDDTLRSIPGFLNDRGILPAVGDFFRQALDLFPDRLPVVMAQMAAVPDDLPGDRPVSLVIGTTQISLSAKENFILGLARGLTSRPDTLGRVMQLAPALRAKLEPAGGLDAVLNLRDSNTERPSSRKLAREARLPKPADSRPTVAQSVPDLLRASQELCSRDPEAARRLLERAGRLLASQEPLTIAAGQLYEQLLDYTVHCEGMVSRDAINQGYRLLTRLRAQANSDGPRTDSAVRMVDHFEASLVAMTALESFGDAMQAAKAVRRENVQFLAYLKMANLLGNR